MQDFTLTTYKKLLQELLTNGYSFQTLQDFVQQPEYKTFILRHDVDRKPENALVIAKIEKETGIKASYYFRTIPQTFKPQIIKEIAEMGHEIGYHYENLSYISKKYEVKDKKKLYEMAIEDFINNLKESRKLVPIKTICMHGSPLSKYDNRDLWKKYDYRDFGIIGEPYFDIDFNEVLYLTDTGRAWNTSGCNVRDKVQSKYNYNFKSTFDIIEALEKNELPDKTMLNVHPQRWTNNSFKWTWELAFQKMKNIAKKAITRLRN